LVLIELKLYNFNIYQLYKSGSSTTVYIYIVS